MGDGVSELDLEDFGSYDFEFTPIGYSSKVIKNRKVAIEESLKEIIQSSEENILLVAGKGHEKQQIIKKKKFAFSDSEVVRSFLDE